MSATSGLPRVLHVRNGVSQRGEINVVQPNLSTTLMLHVVKEQVDRLNLLAQSDTYRRPVRVPPVQTVATRPGRRRRDVETVATRVTFIGPNTTRIGDGTVCVVPILFDEDSSRCASRRIAFGIVRKDSHWST